MPIGNVLITGASSGVGAATALWFAERGWKVWGTSRHLDRVPEHLHRAIRFVKMDSTDDASVQSAVLQVLAEAGHLDLLVNNAGVGITKHRPWPVPLGPWLMTQSWHDLLFAHWAVPADDLATFLPPGLQLDLFEGQAWIGVIPFRMSNVKLRGIVGMPTATAFPELNVLTYVIKDGKPGVWFFSLDAESAFAVAGARHLFHLPYLYAHIGVQEEEEGWIAYSLQRTDRRGKAAAFRARYRPTGPATSHKSALEHWLIERYCLYASEGGRIWRGEIDHAPWSLHPAEVVIHENSMLAALEIALPGVLPLCHFAHRLDVLAWPLKRV